MNQTIHYLFSICALCIKKKTENEKLKSHAEGSKRKKNQ